LEQGERPFGSAMTLSGRTGSFRTVATRNQAKAAAFEKLAEQVAPNTRLRLPSTQFVLKPPSAGV